MSLAMIPQRHRTTTPSTASCGSPLYQRSASLLRPVTLGSAPAAVRDELAAAGEPLGSSTRAQMESRLGRDFSRVRVHTGKTAARAARAIEARAFTEGSHIVFGSGEYSPQTAGGQRLLAHELHHVSRYRPGIVSRAIAADYAAIEDNLSYGVFDWAIRDEEAHEVLEILAGLGNVDLSDTLVQMERDGLVVRLLENISADDRVLYSDLIASIHRRRRVSAIAGHIERLMSYRFLDWVITERDAQLALEALQSLRPDPERLRDVVTAIPAAQYQRFYRNLSDGEWVEEAILNPSNVFENIAHELGGHREYGLPFSFDIISGVLRALPQSERAIATQGPRHLLSCRFPVKDPSRSGGGSSLQRKRDRSPSAGLPPVVHDVLRSHGRPLDPAVRSSMEPRFCHDFSRVRIHTGTPAAESARAVQALAYTVGHHIVFGAGHHVPGHSVDRRLLAHELTHVVQQSGASDTGELEIAPSRDPAELEAQAAEAGVGNGLSGSGDLRPKSRSGTQVQRVPLGTFSLRAEFSDSELLEYLDALDHDRTGEFSRRDNLARAVVRRWMVDGPAFSLSLRRKELLIREMLAGVVGNEDENAILALLRRSPPTETSYLITVLGERRLNRRFQGVQQRRLTRVLEGPVPHTTKICSKSTFFGYAYHAYIDDTGWGDCKGRGFEGNYALHPETNQEGRCGRKTRRSEDPRTDLQPRMVPCRPKRGQTQEQLSNCLASEYESYPDPSPYTVEALISESFRGARWPWLAGLAAGALLGWTVGVAGLVGGLVSGRRAARTRGGHGPSSNTFAGTLARACCRDTSVSSLGWLPGWNHPKPTGTCSLEPSSPPRRSEPLFGMIIESERVPDLVESYRRWRQRSRERRGSRP